MSPIKSLADARRATSGPCAICGAPAASWHRTGLAAGGLLRAAHACEQHEQQAVHALHNLSMEDAVRLTPHHRRIERAAAARRRAARLDGNGAAFGRESARLRGASSHTHTYALLAGAADREAIAPRALEAV